MTKREQEHINESVLVAWEKMRSRGYSSVLASYRLDSCQATVTERGDGYILLTSYVTVVAFIDPNGTMYDVLRYVYGYTATSAKHIAKFRHKFGIREALTYRD